MAVLCRVQRPLWRAIRASYNARLQGAVACNPRVVQRRDYRTTSLAANEVVQNENSSTGLPAGGSCTPSAYFQLMDVL
jgi:hypothetical protein